MMERGGGGGGREVVCDEKAVASFGRCLCFLFYSLQSSFQLRRFAGSSCDDGIRFCEAGEVFRMFHTSRTQMQR